MSNFDRVVKTMKLITAMVPTAAVIGWYESDEDIPEWLERSLSNLIDWAEK